MNLTAQGGNSVRKETEIGLAGSPNNARPRLLLADDSSSIRVALGHLLERSGFVVTQVADGQAVIEALGQGIPEVLLLDLAMPGLDGWQTLRRVRELCPMLPVVVLTAQSQQQTWAKEVGVPLLEKPVEPEALLAALWVSVRCGAPRPPQSSVAHSQPADGTGRRFVAPTRWGGIPDWH